MNLFQTIAFLWKLSWKNSKHGNVADIAENNERLIDRAAVENVGNHANNNDNHDVADAPVGNVADIAYNNERLSDAAAV
jgi:hypothetical protein